jgi:hypothetical protein
MKLPRRQFLYQVAGAAALPAVSRVAWAQAYPTNPLAGKILWDCYSPAPDRHRGSNRIPSWSFRLPYPRPSIFSKSFASVSRSPGTELA